jgi:mannose-1-phosphate guanylyltransferase
MNEQQTWAVILAGGDGARLKSLTRILSGDERPKQFCSLCGEETLLTQTRARVSRAVLEERTLFALARAHEPYYRKELADIGPSRMIVQPANRGTTAAIIYSLLRIARFDEDAIVGFFPTDHYYADERRFAAAVQLAFEVSRRRPELLVLLGAEAQYPEVEYGWIEPSTSLKCGVNSSLFRVSRFWEKPSLPLAQLLLAHGCLWNTFVMIGRSKTFLDMLGFAVPRQLAAFESIVRRTGVDVEAKTADHIYATLSSGDFSRQVLSVCRERLAVLRLGDVGWSDLGTPARVAAAITRGRTTAAEQRAAQDEIRSERVES